MVKRDIAVTYYFARLYVCACMLASGFVPAITPTFMHGFQNYVT